MNFCRPWWNPISRIRNTVCFPGGSSSGKFFVKSLWQPKKFVVYYISLNDWYRILAFFRMFCERRLKIEYGDVPKRLKGPDSKSGRRRKVCGGSNPSISRSIKSQRSRGLGQTTGCVELARKQTDGWHRRRICGAYPWAKHEVLSAQRKPKQTLSNFCTLKIAYSKIHKYLTQKIDTRHPSKKRSIERCTVCEHKQPEPTPATLCRM